MVGGRHPVGGAANGRAGGYTLFVGRASRQHLRPAVGANAARPRQLLHERTPDEHLPVGAIEHVEEAVAIGLQQQLARLPLERRIHQNERLFGIPVPQIVGRELEMPAELAGLRIQREHGIGIQVVARPPAAVGIGIRIARGPEQRAGLGIVAARQPRGSTALVELGITFPCFRSRLSRRGHGPEAPCLPAGLDVIRRDKTANARIAARYTRDDEVADDQRRGRAAVRLRSVLGQHGFPQQRAVHAAERHEVRVVGDQKDAGPEHRHTAIETDTRVTCQSRRAGARKAPQLAARGRVERRHLIGRADIHDAVEHERRCFVVEPTQRVHPARGQSIDVRRVDLRVRAVPIAVEPAMVGRPVTRPRLQNLVEVPRIRFRAACTRRTCRAYALRWTSRRTSLTHLDW